MQRGLLIAFASLFSICLLAGCSNALASEQDTQPLAEGTATPTPQPPVGIYTADDLRAMFEGLPPERKLIVSDDVAVHLMPGIYEPTTAEWVGAAVMYHIPSMSSITFDWNGQIADQRYETDGGRQQLVAMLADEEMMIEVRLGIVSGTYPADEAVFQIYQESELAGFGNSITVWGDGRVEVVGLDRRRYGNPRRPYTVYQMDRGDVAKIIQAAQIINGMDSTYVNDNLPQSRISRANSTFFTVRTAGVYKSVAVHGMFLDSDNERGDDAIGLLNALYTMVQRSLPFDPISEAPESVVVMATPATCEDYVVSDSFLPREWQPELIGLLHGEHAQAATRLLRPGNSHCFVIAGELHEVALTAWLPLLHLPSIAWAGPGLPIFDWMTAYNHEPHVYQVPEAYDFDIAGFYSKAMPEDGWRLAKETEHSLQVWVREQHGSDPVVVLRFEDGSFAVEALRVNDGIPQHPGAMRNACDGVWCQRIQGLTMDGARDWFDEFMGYLGWQETASDTYRRDGSEVRLAFRAVGDGVEVAEQGDAVRPVPVQSVTAGAPALIFNDTLLLDGDSADHQQLIADLLDALDAAVPVVLRDGEGANTRGTRLVINNRDGTTITVRRIVWCGEWSRSGNSCGGANQQIDDRWMINGERVVESTALRDWWNGVFGAPAPFILH